jgi:hypothetical protein
MSITTKDLRKAIFDQIEETLKESSLIDRNLVDRDDLDRLSQVLVQLRDVGWSHVIDCDDNFTRVTFIYKANSEESDVCDNDEVLTCKVKLPKNFPIDGPICDDGFPASFSLKKYFWASNKSTLAHTYATFVDRAKSLIPVRVP